jgi:hypothetical protein
MEESSISIVTHQNPSNLRNREPDLEQFRLSQDFEAMIGVRKEIITVPVRKPDRQSFIQIHPDEDWRMPALILELKEDRDNYLVIPSLMESFPDEFVPKCLFTCQTKQGATFLWPIRMHRPDGRLDQWNESALHIVNEYAGRWIRVISNMDLGGYEVVSPTNDFPPPDWPEEGFQSLVKKAFRGKVIDTLDHPVIKRLRGDL